MSATTVPEGHRVAVLIPCYNEAVTIGKVINDFRRELPSAEIHVYDNNSTDETASIAAAAGAVVVKEKRQGKGFVVQSMFMDIDADLYVMVDGDDTYPADQVGDLIRPVIEGRADMTVGNRMTDYGDQSFRPMHIFGNRLVVWSVNRVFGAKVRDVMSGYRAFSAEAVRRIPIVSKGFEVETELTLQALYRGFVIAETPVRYGVRPAGSYSKLSTYRDGARVLVKIVDIFKAYRPLMFFGLIGAALALLGLALGAIPIVEFLQTGKILRFPTAFLAASLEVMALVSIACGVILDNLNHHFREVGQLLLKVERTTRRRNDPAADKPSA